MITFTDRKDLIDLAVSLRSESLTELLLRIHSDRMMGRHAEQTPTTGSTLVHRAESTEDPGRNIRIKQTPELGQELTCYVHLLQPRQNDDPNDGDDNNAVMGE